jgi:hypothetical protein
MGKDQLCGAFGAVHRCSFTHKHYTENGSIFDSQKKMVLFSGEIPKSV